MGAWHYPEKFGELALGDRDSWGGLLGLSQDFLGQLHDAIDGLEFGSEDWEEGPEPYRDPLMEVRRPLGFSIVSNRREKGSELNQKGGVAHCGASFTRIVSINGSFKVNLSEFYTIFSDATEEYLFEQVRWPFPPYEERKPPLFAQFHSLPTGLKESAEYPFSPVSAVYRMISPTREVGWVSTRTWVHMLELSESDTVDLLHAQEGLLDTPRRREIRERLEEIIGDPVPSWRSGCGNLVLYKEKPTKPIFLETFYEKFTACVEDCVWTYVPWPSKHCRTHKIPERSYDVHPFGGRWGIKSMRTHLLS